MKIKAILCSDIHLSEVAPVARSAEPDWFVAMRRPLDELRILALQNKVPIICAGDIFDKWKSSPALINFALDKLPDMYAVPGQHDLPHHNYDDMFKSAFGVLVNCAKIKVLPNKPTLINGVYYTGFGWGRPIEPPASPYEGHLEVAVVHAYIWQHTKGFPGAAEEQRVGAYVKQLEGYNTAVFGDNHKPFVAQAGSCTVFNHGGFMRRKIDEIDHKPAVGLLMSDGSVRRHFLDCSQDKFITKEQAKFTEEAGFKMQEFLKGLEKLGSTELDFKDAVKTYLRTYEVSKGARDLIIELVNR